MASLPNSNANLYLSQAQIAGIRGSSKTAMIKGMFGSYGPDAVHYFEVTKLGPVYWQGSDPDLHLKKFWEVQVWHNKVMYRHNRVGPKKLHAHWHPSENVPKALKAQIVLLGINPDLKFSKPVSFFS